MHACIHSYTHTCMHNIHAHTHTNAMQTHTRTGKAPSRRTLRLEKGKSLNVTDAAPSTPPPSAPPPPTDATASPPKPVPLPNCTLETRDSVSACMLGSQPRRRRLCRDGGLAFFSRSNAATHRARFACSSRHLEHATPRDGRRIQRRKACERERRLPDFGAQPTLLEV